MVETVTRTRFGRRWRTAFLVLGAVALAWAAAFSQARLPLAPLETDVPITWFVADGDLRTGFEPGDRQLAEWALDAWRRSAGAAVRLEPSAEAAARIRIFWAPPGIGQYGEAQTFLLGGRRGAALYIHPDMESLGADIAGRAQSDHLLRDSIVYLTCLHELGHAFGLDHTAAFADIMYSFEYGGDIVEYFERYRRQIRSRDDIAKVSGLSASDLARVGALYRAGR